ncbi:spermidine synthase [Streptomyces capparidis]
MSSDDTAPAVVLDRRTGPWGEVALRRRGGERGTYEIIANGCFLMDTSDGRSERLLVRAALDALGPRERPTVLIGGLGVGFSLAEAAAEPRWGRIVVVEREQAVIDWHRGGPLARFSGAALDTDPRVELVRTDLTDLTGEPGEAFDAMCLDVDNGPDWTVTDANAGLYGDAGLAALRGRLTPGGVLAVWAARHSAEFERRLRAHFAQVRTLRVEVPRGEPDVVHLAQAPLDGNP